MAKIVYGQRYATLQTYDTDFITFLENLGHFVVNLQSSEVPAYDYTNIDLFIIGAPGTDNLVYPEATFLQTLEVDILSLCRNTSRYTFGMSLGSGVSTVSSFTVDDTTHEITEGLSGTILIGSSQTCHRLHNLTAETNLILNIGTAGYAGVSEIFVTLNTESYKRVFWGYHEIGSLNIDGSDLLERVINYLVPLSGYFISLPTDLSSFGVSNPDLKVKWKVEDLSVDSVMIIYTAITGQSGGVPIEPTEGDWNIQENDTPILGLPLDLTDQYLWVKVFMDRSTTEILSPKLYWLVVYNNTDSPLTAIRLEFAETFRTIDETGSTLYEKLFQEEEYSYNAYALTLTAPDEYVYLTSGNFYFTEASVEKTIIIDLLSTVKVYPPVTEISFTTLAPTVLATGAPVTAYPPVGEVSFSSPIPTIISSHLYASQDPLPSVYESIVVEEGTLLADVIAFLPSKITVYDSKGNSAEADITWEIPGYNPNVLGNYIGYGTVILPEGWYGEPSEIQISVTISSTPDTPPIGGSYRLWAKKSSLWPTSSRIWVKKMNRWVEV